MSRPAQFLPFNAAQTLALATDIEGARTNNALQRFLLQQEQNPTSFVNRARELNLESDELQTNVLREQFEQAQLANAVPGFRVVLGAIGEIKDTISRRGVSAGRQKLSERISFLKNQGILAEDFELETDLDSLSDEEFVRTLETEEQNLASVIESFTPAGRTSAAIGDMQRLGFPMTPEGFRQFNEARGGGAEGLEALLAEARLRGVLIEQETAAEERRQVRTAQRQSIERNLDQTKTAVDLTERLEGTMLESGSFVPADFRRGLASMGAAIGRLRGQDTSDIQQMIADFDTQRKVLEDQVNSRIASGDYGQSATQLQSIQRSLANPDISPAAIIRIQGQIAEIDLDRAEAQDIQIRNRAEWERRIKAWKSFDPISASSISKMTREQIGQLPIDSLSDELAEAALRRLDELE